MINNSETWQNLITLQKQLSQQSLFELFAAEANRSKICAIKAAGLYLDYSKNFITPAVLKELLELTKISQLPEKVSKFFSGEIVNLSEQRAAEHHQLRKTNTAAKPEILQQRQKIQQLCQEVQTGKRTGYTGKAFTDVVNIGIGGSDLGPRLIYNALKEPNARTLHFLSSFDHAEFTSLINTLNPETTLFVVASKSFTTAETLFNFHELKQWLEAKSSHNNAWQQHFLAVTAKTELALDHGFLKQNIFSFSETIGGRYSIWSAIGLSCALCIGFQSFQSFLEGAAAMDTHFQETSYAENMPVIMALLEIWYTTFWGSQTLAIIPYSSKLKFLPAYFQQLIMESNGKSVNQTGKNLPYATSPIIWGASGTSCQHSFMQLLHQSKLLIPTDFITFLSDTVKNSQQEHLFAHCVSQARVLMLGKSLAEIKADMKLAGYENAYVDEIAPQKVLPGNSPSNILAIEKFSAFSLGALIALYEHKTFVAAMIWDINPFDQWGVEMGKKVAAEALQTLKNQNTSLDFDPSTNTLLRLYREKNYDPT